MTENNYIPQDSGRSESADDIHLLASRWDRLWAALIDGITMMCIIVPLMYFTGGIDDIANDIEPSMTYNLFMSAMSIIIFIILHGKLLVNNGQTIGKKILGIKIVDLNGNLPTVKEHLLKRYAFYFISGQIPLVGPFISLLNLLFIFSKSKRCLHDHLAGTVVVNS